VRDSTALIEAVRVGCYTIPTDTPESDGTLEWNSTTLVTASIDAGGVEGFGYGYADKSTAVLIRDRLGPLLTGRDALAVNARWADMVRSVRNLGRPGIASMAISVVDVALWDLKGRLLGMPLAVLLGAARESIRAYGSGGFTSYDVGKLQAQLAGWVGQGFDAVKMKIGRDPAADLERMTAARQAIGEAPELFVDANGAYTRAQAAGFAERMAALGVTWFEEPVSSDDLEGLRQVRDHRPGGMSIAAGEYGYDAPYFLRMLRCGSVDVLQADATRCGGVTGFMQAAALCEAFGLPLSSHCAPALHVPLCCAATRSVHLEYFHDHARIENALFEGTPRPVSGRLRPELSRPGLGLSFKAKEAECYSS
jgi:L-alanine-DL-glutamate epimerase-like enolase superfamily enzyme